MPTSQHNSDGRYGPQSDSIRFANPSETRLAELLQRSMHVTSSRIPSQAILDLGVADVRLTLTWYVVSTSSINRIGVVLNDDSTVRRLCHTESRLKFKYIDMIPRPQLHPPDYEISRSIYISLFSHPRSSNPSFLSALSSASRLSKANLISICKDIFWT